MLVVIRRSTRANYFQLEMLRTDWADMWLVFVQPKPHYIMLIFSLTTWAAHYSSVVERLNNSRCFLSAKWTNWIIRFKKCPSLKLLAFMSGCNGYNIFNLLSPL